MELRKSFDTIRYLRIRQILGQLRKRLRSLWGDHTFSRSLDIPDFPGVSSFISDDFLPPGGQRNTAGDLLSGTFTFLNSTHSIGWFPDWGPEDLPKLWEYNLHYFEWLWALEYSEAKNVVSDWIERYDLRRGRVGWEPYPISLRLINWCIIFFGRFRDRTEADREFLDKLWRSIFIQSQWLSRNLEVHLLGNHFFENGTALVLVGSCFKGLEADRWYQKGKRIVTEEIHEQVLSDGMHFERSPMYHLRYIYLLLLLMRTGRDDVRTVARAAGEMISALKYLCHPDGEIALFNDSAFGIYNHPRELIDLWEKETDNAAGNQVIGSWALPEAGYYGFRDREDNYFICDAGPIGPDYIPAHAHGDIFSFELSLRGSRVVVDSGVGGYEPGPARDYDRSTRAHNTVEIEGEDQAEFWGSFRVARRGRPREVRHNISKGSFFLESWHDGYRRLPGAPIHHRSFHRKLEGIIEVRDRVIAAHPIHVVSRIHLHPKCRIEKCDGDEVMVSHPGGRFLVAFSGPGELELEKSFYSPRFGSRFENTTVAFSAHGAEISNGFRIIPGG